MIYKKQKDLFLESEGDAWFKRNEKSFSKNFRDMKVHNATLSYLLSLPIANNKNINLIEIGCGEGSLLSHIRKERHWNLYGIDPSKEAIQKANKVGINASVGTADNLSFKENTFDIILFGFCLYLCDINDLFKIANQTNRIAKKKAWIIIVDFWSDEFRKVPYKHLEGVYSSKYDFSKMFSWHPHYPKIDHKLRDFSDFNYTDNKDNWLSITSLRKLDN